MSPLDAAPSTCAIYLVTEADDLHDAVIPHLEIAGRRLQLLTHRGAQDVTPPALFIVDIDAPVWTERPAPWTAAPGRACIAVTRKVTTARAIDALSLGALHLFELPLDSDALEHAIAGAEARLAAEVRGADDA